MKKKWGCDGIWSGEKYYCHNFRWITIISIAHKVITGVLFNLLQQSVAEETVYESQCGFIADIGETVMALVHRLHNGKRQ